MLRRKRAAPNEVIHEGVKREVRLQSAKEGEEKAGIRMALSPRPVVPTLARLEAAQNQLCVSGRQKLFKIDAQAPS